MPMYVFSCPGREHQGDREFTQIFHTVPAAVINQYQCPQPQCQAVAKRRFDKEIPSQSVIGLTPISHSTTGKGSFQKTVEKAFGGFKKNPDGSIDPNHAAFRDSGEFQKFMNGANDLGKPKINQRTGEVLRRRDGSVIREGAKIFQYGKNDAPSRNDVRRRPRQDKSVEWVDDRSVRDFPDTNSKSLTS